MGLFLATLEWRFKPYSELTQNELHAIFKLRQAVFIVEQNCPYPDIDGQDDRAYHLMAWNDDSLVATSRIFPEYDAYDGRCSIGRICSHLNYRGTGIGRELVSRSVSIIDRKYPQQATQIGAQLYLQAFYESFGFVRCSDVYLEDGIEHILMLRQAAQPDDKSE